MKGKFVQEKGEHNALIKSLMKHFEKDEEDLLDEDQEEVSHSLDEEVLPKHLREVFMKSKKYKDGDEDEYSGEYDLDDAMTKDAPLSQEDDDEVDYDVDEEEEEEEMPDRADKETRKKMVIALMKKGM